MPRLSAVGRCGVAMLLAAGAARGQAAAGDGSAPPSSTQPAAQPPAYTPVRFDEDYSYLKRSPDADRLDALKFIPLNGKGDAYLSFGGQARYRFEFFENANFGAGPQDDNGFHLLRILGHADLHAGENLRFFAQGISAQADDLDGGARPFVDENDLDLHQVFAEARLALPCESDSRGDLTARVGRQNVLLGAQRLVSPLDWTNTRRTFDGMRAGVEYGRANRLDLFWMRPVIIDEGPLDEFWNPDSDEFAGIYNVLMLPQVLEGGGTRLEQYLLYVERDPGAFHQGSGDERRFTLGARFATKPAPWDFDVEGAYQLGDFRSGSGDGDISAFFVAAEAGYVFADAPLSPRAFAGGTYASGDDDPADPSLETFNHLYPLAHAYLGYADVLGRQNAIDVYVGADLNLLAGERRLAKKLSLQTTYHALWRASTGDAIYTIGGAVGRFGGDERFVGHEIDILLNWQIDRHFSSYAGISHVLPGSFIEDTGPSEDLTFAYLALMFSF